MIGWANQYCKKYQKRFISHNLMKQSTIFWRWLYLSSMEASCWTELTLFFSMVSNGCNKCLRARESGTILNWNAIQTSPKSSCLRMKANLKERYISKMLSQPFLIVNWSNKPLKWFRALSLQGLCLIMTN